MSDLSVRTLIVLGVVVTSLLVIAILRRRSGTNARTIKAPGLDPGKYFFSSSACSDCSPSRQKLVARYGTSGFVEYSWESDREILEALRIDQVPATLVVDESGVGTLWPGVPDSMFSGLDP